MSARASAPLCTALLLAAACLLVSAQPLRAETTMEAYVREGLRRNHTLRQKQFDLRRTLAELSEARRAFYPSLSLHARYTWNRGGREMDVPVGDMLGEIYTALNQVTPGAPYPTEFSDESVSLMPEREQETKVRLSQPIILPRMWFNLRLSNRNTEIKELEVALFRRSLTAEIKEAYLNHWKAREAVQVYEETLSVLRENLRVSRQLVAGGKATEDAVFRAQAEIAEVMQRRAEALRNRRVAASYLNFLAGRPLDDPVRVMDHGELSVPPESDLETYTAHALSMREELRLVRTAIGAQDEAIWLARSGNLPEVTAAFDYGFVGEEYRFTADEDFWTATILLEWDLFDGLRSPARVGQARWRKKQLQAELQQTQERIRLDVLRAYEDLNVALGAIRSTEEAAESSRKSFEIVSRKYEQGMATQMEYMDARSRLTRAEIGRRIALLDYHVQAARLQSAAALGRHEAGALSTVPR